MRKLRVGVLVKRNFTPTVGGAFTYYHRLFEGIDKHDFDPNLEIVFLSFGSKSFNTKKEFFTLSSTSISYYLKKAITKIPVLYSVFGNRVYSRLRKKMAQHKIDIIYSLMPGTSDLIEDFPFVSTVWDMGHKTMPAFPEVSAKKIIEHKERFFQSTLNQALAIFAESNIGKKDLIKYGNFDEHRIHVVPMFPSKIVDHQVPQERQIEILEERKLEKNNFFFYPAQFWPHKNHYNLLKAFQQKFANSTAKLVLVGSNKGNFDYVKSLIDEFKISSQVVLPGFVSDDELYTFYKNSLSLVMPTFLGPSNMPLLEARELNCPVLCSNLEGHQDMLQESALYFDPADSDDIGRVMSKMFDPVIREDLLLKANKEMESSQFNLNGTLKAINDSFLKIKNIRHCWPT